MINIEKLFYFLIIIFILLLISTIYKMHSVKKENFTTINPSTVNMNMTPNNYIEPVISQSTTSFPTTTINNDKISKFQESINNINNTITRIEEDTTEFNRDQLQTVKNIYANKKDRLFDNLELLNDKTKLYSEKMNKILQKNLDYDKYAIQMNQNIKESRVRDLEEEISKIEKNNTDLDDNFINSLVCNANSTKLNIYPIKIGTKSLNEFLIFLNDNCLSYKIKDSDFEIKVNNCEINSSSDYKMNFILKEIKDYVEYNNAIKIERKEQKSLVMKNDDINYPFYLIQPTINNGKCIYISNNNILNIKSITNSPNVRFRGSNTIGECISK